MRACLISLLLAAPLLAQEQPATASLPPVPSAIEDAWHGCIQEAALDSRRPFFLPTHPRVTLTVRFPKTILDIDGAGFTTDPAQVIGEYIISWREADSFFSITPLPGAGLRNCNVVVGDQTVVLVTYPVDSPLEALTSLTFRSPEEIAAQAALAQQANSPRKVFGKGAQGAPVSTPSGSVSGVAPAPVTASQDGPVKRLERLPEPPFGKVGPARMIGMLDRLKLLHAARPDELDSVLAAMPDVTVFESGKIQDCGLYKLQLVRVARDSRLDLLGFIVIVRNVSMRTITFNSESWAARLGLSFFKQATSDFAPEIKPGGTHVAYFVIHGDSRGRPGYMLAENDWTVSVELLSPRLNPGATIAAGFAGQLSRRP